VFCDDADLADATDFSRLVVVETSWPCDLFCTEDPVVPVVPWKMIWLRNARGINLNQCRLLRGSLLQDSDATNAVTKILIALRQLESDQRE